MWGQAENNFILYMDVLGGEKIIDSPQVVKLSTFMKWALDETKRVNLMYNRTANEEQKIYFKMFSDNIIICTKSNYKFLLQIAAGWQRKLSDLGIFLRGALCHGSIIKEDDFVLGSGLVKAYKLESNCAKYPRIIIDESFSEKIDADILGAYTTRFRDNVLFIDYLRLAINGLCRSEVASFFMNHAYAIKNNLFYATYATRFSANENELRTQEKILIKHKSLRGYHDNFMKITTLDCNGDVVDCFKYFSIGGDISKWRDLHLWHLKVIKCLPSDFVAHWEV